MSEIVKYFLGIRFSTFGAKLKWIRNRARAVYYSGSGRYCPVCAKQSRRFLEAGRVQIRRDAQCPQCGALERHRLTWLYITHSTDLFESSRKKMLHVAAIPCYEERLTKLLGDGYLTADLFDPRSMVRMDITNIEYPSESFDIILCSHVLEHVEDDRRALREIYRTLKSNGWAILNVPITADETFEDQAIIHPRERLAAFGQEDHVRRYGLDYIDRLRDVGFSVNVIGVSDVANDADAIRMGLTSYAGVIFFCQKSSTRS